MSAPLQELEEPRPCAPRLPPAFSSYYEAIFARRWEALKAALAAAEPKTAYTSGLLKPYFMSAGSIAAAKALFFDKDAPPQNVRILDLCAAPGGKSLVLASSMGEDAELVANELSAARRRRLIAVLDEHLPLDARRRARVTGFDGARWSRYERECFDYILLDAPCSSERHVMADAKSLAQWTAARVKSLSARQWALLSGAWLLLRPGGRLVYATCALTPAENSRVVERLLKKYPDSALSYPPAGFFEQISPAIHAERESCGVSILPDTSGGAGPIFFAIAEKAAR